MIREEHTKKWLSEQINVGEKAACEELYSWPHKTFWMGISRL